MRGARQGGGPWHRPVPTTTPACPARGGFLRLTGCLCPLAVTVNEVEALYELFKTVSNSLVRRRRRALNLGLSAPPF